MERTEILNHLKAYIPISDDAFELFMSLMEQKTVKKNKYVYKCGDSKLPFLWIKSGYLMTYYTDYKNHDHVMQFGSTMWWTGDLEAILQQKPTRYSVKAITDAEVYELSLQNFEKLVQQQPVFEKYFRIIYQNSLISHQKRIINNISLNAQEKYDAFTQKFPKIELTVPQKYIASYLGMTPEFLSTIKSQRLKEQRKSD